MYYIKNKANILDIFIIYDKLSKSINKLDER